MKYEIIYADPPWKYEAWSPKGNGRSAESHYPTMNLQDICNLPVATIADTNCALFLWVTFPKLQEGLDVLKAWGFSYRTVAFVWVKQNKKSKTPFFGMGRWTRANAEICLLGIKGTVKRQSAKVHQLIISPLRNHSQKPDETREKIIELLGERSKIELFARTKTEGWDIWGNEVNCNMDLLNPNKQAEPVADEVKATGTD
jgi:N6-adenosine-specific RNA methylase IME4